jgi:hypothetical protein
MRDPPSGFVIQIKELAHVAEKSTKPARSRCGRNATPKDFSQDCGELPQLSPNSCATSASSGTGDAQSNDLKWGGAMRDYSELGIPDTAPYKEWLGVVGSMLVAALLGIVLYSGAFLT